MVSFKFTKGKARQAMALGDLEREALEVLWNHENVSGKEIFDILGKKKKIQHNTILTVLERLIKKGLVGKKKSGKNNTYFPRLTREQFTEKISAPLIEELFDMSSNAAMAAFVDNARRDPAVLDELKRLIEQAEEHGKKLQRTKKENKE
jgi:predicted transcriptional regulator